jgi:hypothetical protein
MERTPCQTLDDGTLVFSIRPELLTELQAWQEQVDRGIAEQQVRTGKFFDGSRLSKNVLQGVRQSLERGEPRPYRGAIGGAYTYLFTPTALGCVVEVRSMVTRERSSAQLCAP